jgi:hypothetical protein
VDTRKAERVIMKIEKRFQDFEARFNISVPQRLAVDDNALTEKESSYEEPQENLNTSSVCHEVR